MDNERYLQMGCACGAEWIEDRLEPVATCPWCDLKLTWDQLATSDRMGVLGPGRIDMSPEHFREIMNNCSFVETKNPSGRSRYDSSIWTHLYSTSGTIWEITIQLLFLVAAIARAMQTMSDERTPLSEGIFCGEPLEAA